MYCHNCGSQLSVGATFCGKCGAGQNGAVAAGSSMPAPVTKKKGGAWKFYLGPLIAFVAILVVWGFLNVLGATFGFEESVFMHIFKLIMPILILLVVPCIPIGIIIGLVRTFGN